MKTRILILMVTLIMYSLIYSQPLIEVTKTLQPATHQIEKNGSSYSTGSYGIGFEVSSSKIFRTYYVYDLTELTSAQTIEEVKINWYVSDSRSYNWKITELASEPDNYQSGYTSIGNSSQILSGLAYSIVQVVSPSTTLKSSIQGKLSSGKLVLGALSLTESGSNDSYANATISLTVKYKRPANQIYLEAKNDMESYNGGLISAGWGSTPLQTWSSPKFFEPYENESFSLEAIDNQTYNGYSWVFNDSEAAANKSRWLKEKSGDVSVISTGNAAYSGTATSSNNNAAFIAELRKICSVSFQNDLDYTSGTGQVTVNGIAYSAPTSNFPVVKANEIAFTAQQIYTFGDNVGIEYNFKYWTSNGSWVSSNLSKTLSISEHKSLTAEYEATPQFSNSNYRNLTLNSSPRNVGDPIVLNWNEHPNSNVTLYKVYRKYHDSKFNDVQGETLMATLNRETTTWTDSEFLVGTSLSEYSIFYDVRAYYSSAGTFSTIEWVALMGDPNTASKEIAENEINTDKIIVDNYSIGNFPNPFNPATTINYQLPEQGHVTIKVYDMLGKEVAELVNGAKDMGIYNVAFDGSNLASGIYVYTIQVKGQSAESKGYAASKKMLLIK